VYFGASLPVNAFLMVPVKVGIFVTLIRVLYVAFWPLHNLWQFILIAAATGSLIFGALTTLGEKLFKRFLVTTSINQIGLLLLGLSTVSLQGLQATVFYLFVYSLTTLMFFCTILGVHYNYFEIQSLSWLNIITQKNATVSIILTILFFNMGGFPPLLGFFSKFYLLLEVGLSGN
jgi:NADH-quinone oxidoreductase subunit N